MMDTEKTNPEETEANASDNVHELEVEASAESEDEPTDDLESQLEAAKQEALDNKDRYLRAVADAENLRRRHEKERTDLLKFGSEKILQDILPILDSFDKALTETSTDANDAFAEGIKMVNRQLLDMLEKHGLKVIDSKGEEFDPNLHQGIQRIEDESVTTEVVRDEFQKGYLLNDRLLRAAMVSVAVPAEGQQGD